MDTEKVKAVVDWLQPTSRVQLQHFMGFAHFYQCFIRGYSTLAAPLLALTSPNLLFIWFPAVDRAFVDLKHQFTTALNLVHPDPSRQFVVEVDASDVGVGAILSIQDIKLHPCAFLSYRLNSAERNYDQPRTPGGQDDTGGVETLAGGSRTSIFGLDRSQEFGISPNITAPCQSQAEFHQTSFCPVHIPGLSRCPCYCY